MRRLGDSLHDVARSLGMPEPDGLSRIMAVWSELVGEAVARHTRPARLRDQVLTVEVDGGEWVTQLRYLESSMVSAITERVGPGLVDRVVFAVARLT